MKKKKKNLIFTSSIETASIRLIKTIKFIFSLIKFIFSFFFYISSNFHLFSWIFICCLFYFLPICNSSTSYYYGPVIYAGTGSIGWTGDSGPANAATLHVPSCLNFNSNKGYICDANNQLIRQVNSGIISTIMGTLNTTGDNTPTTPSSVRFNYPRSIDIDQYGDIYVANSGGHNVVVYAPIWNSVIDFAGTGTAGFSGDGGKATSGQLNSPYGLCLNNMDLYIADTFNHRIRKIDYSTGWTNNIISTFAGTGTAGFSGDNGPATNANLNYPRAIYFDGK